MQMPQCLSGFVNHDYCDVLIQDLIKPSSVYLNEALQGAAHKAAYNEDPVKYISLNVFADKTRVDLFQCAPFV